MKTTFILLLSLVSCSYLKLHPDAGLNIEQFLKKYGYPIEYHKVCTEDGYILTLHRIPYGRQNANKTKQPVLLMHGLLVDSMSWVNMGPSKSLALILADGGYDVWLGNQRGNTWSRKHSKYDSDKYPEKFFDFSFHEIGVYDLPAKIDYILKQTKQKQLYYVGHSQGSTAFFVMASEKPQYNKKIKFMSALAPVAFSGNLKNPFIKLAAKYQFFIDVFTDYFKIYEFLSHQQFITDLSNNFCNDDSKFQIFCVYFIFSIVGFDFSQLNSTFLPVITTNNPAGCSIKQIKHYLQEIISHRFCKYDYGSLMNFLKYGQIQAPLYDLEKITTPIALFYGKNDLLSAPIDVEMLAKALPVVLAKRSYAFFNHIDFLWAKDVGTLVNNYILNDIKNN